MVETAKSWFRENSTLIYFLAAQALAIGAAATSILAYAVRLETRVSIMETRGAEYTVERLSQIDKRITVLEQAVHKDQARLERIVDMLTQQKK